MTSTKILFQNENGLDVKGVKRGFMKLVQVLRIGNNLSVEMYIKYVIALNSK